MSHHLIDISAPSCAVTCKNGQLIFRTDPDILHSLPMEDVGALIINSFSAQMHNRVFIEAARHGTVIVFCEKFRPAGLLLPANRATDTVLTRAHFKMGDSLRNMLWRKTVTAKCRNQAALARVLVPALDQTRRLAEAAENPRPTKESTCARLYWAVVSSRLRDEKFSRSRKEGALNNLLNYGYMVLLARMLQKMMAVGLDPTFGIGHAPRERATPLAYDLMEPFRVGVDARVLAWVEKESDMSVSKEYKKWVQGFLELRAPYEKKQIKLELVMERVLHSFRESLLSKRASLYKPWTLENTKWDGFL